jgi:hypothetical protein
MTAPQTHIRESQWEGFAEFMAAAYKPGGSRYESLTEEEREFCRKFLKDIDNNIQESFSRVNDFWVRIYIGCLAEAVGKAIPDDYNMRQFNKKSVVDREAFVKEAMSTAAATFLETKMQSCNGSKTKRVLSGVNRKRLFAG